MATATVGEEAARVAAHKRESVLAYQVARRRAVQDATLASFVGAALGAAAGSFGVQAAAPALANSLATIGIGGLRATPSSWAAAAAAIAGGALATALFARERGLADALDTSYLSAIELTESEHKALRRVT
jgi:hypothetical protein